MILTVTATLAALLTVGEPQLAVGTQLYYQGTVAKVDRDPSAQAAEKSFDLTLLVTRSDADGIDFYWLLDDRGAGGFTWIDRVGRWSQDARAEPVGMEGPALLFDYGTGKHVIALPPPKLFVPAGVAGGTTWQHDGLDYTTVRADTVVERRAWEIEARNQFGPRRRVWADQATQVVLQEDERVFMNQGTEYRLAMQLRGVSTVESEELSKLTAGFAAMVSLKEKVRRPARKTDDVWAAAELKALAAHLPEAVKQIHGGGLERIASAAERDLTRLTDRSSALTRLTTEHVGKAVEPFQLEGLDGAKLSDADLRDSVVVLHFWEYRDEPLKEPYGQVGYLEFLRGRHEKAGLKVFGIAVDGRFREPAGAKAAVVGVRKLKNFMNLGYPILFDGGALIERFGDPRPAGAELPLFVVIGRDGKVAHHKAGHYDVDREAGLKQLDAVVTKLLSAE